MMLILWFACEDVLPHLQTGNRRGEFSTALSLPFSPVSRRLLGRERAPL